MADALNSLDLPGRPADCRVVVAMSGGVDSSVVAGMLAGEGYDVVGVTLQLYDHGEAVHRAAAYVMNDPEPRTWRFSIQLRSSPGGMSICSGPVRSSR